LPQIENHGNLAGSEDRHENLKVAHRVKHSPGLLDDIGEYNLARDVKWKLYYM